MEPQVEPIGALQFGSLILDRLPYEPTTQQVQLIAALARFYALTETEANRAFLLCGYAGTGKTSLIGAMVMALRSLGREVVLLAPTGRAAKVFAAFARHPAYTIHRKIYRSTPEGFHICSNPHTHTLFIVDEASMIGESDSLLSDLIHYVYSAHGCRLLLMGDTAQLPPVGMEVSPAMSVDYLRSMGLKVSRAQLTQTVRQASESGILHNATWLRKAMLVDPIPSPHLTVTPYDDLEVIGPEELEDRIGESYRDQGVNGAILITRSNRRAVRFNVAIREQILGREGTLARGESLMIAKNNYHWSKDIAALPFIANGEIATVAHINSEYWRYGMRWADVTLDLTYRDIQLDATLLLDTLTSDTASLPDEQMARLAEEILADPDFVSGPLSASQRRQVLKSNPYFNALQVKYAYAVTCHKAQGGQWPDVYVDLGGIAPEALCRLDFYRWLYTAVTRAVDRLFFISPTLEVR